MAANKIVFWALDYSNRSGEGKLGRLFISKLKENKKTNKIVLIKSLFTKKKTISTKFFFLLGYINILGQSMELSNYGFSFSKVGEFAI